MGGEDAGGGAGREMVTDALRIVARTMREQAARIDEYDPVTAGHLLRGSDAVCRVLLRNRDVI